MIIYTTHIVNGRIIFTKHLERTISYPPPPHSSLNFCQSFYHLCQNLSKVSVSRLLETFSTYITVWGPLGMQLPHIVSAADRDRQIQTNTDKYRQIQTNTDKYKQIQTQTLGNWHYCLSCRQRQRSRELCKMLHKHRQISTNINKYQQILTNIDKYRQISKILTNTGKYTQRHGERRTKVCEADFYKYRQRHWANSWPLVLFWG